jgi:hypothetical protein
MINHPRLRAITLLLIAVAAFVRPSVSHAIDCGETLPMQTLSSGSTNTHSFNAAAGDVVAIQARREAATFIPQMRIGNSSCVFRTTDTKHFDN